ncbi:hypothetical protein Bbelb_275670 [Branchiostoma belcheri]|nr:hypothetical protein Bbelb_275670 [Branchiostoma belcheri]
MTCRYRWVASGGVVVRAIDYEPGDSGSIPSRAWGMSEHAPRRCALGKGTLHEFPHSTQDNMGKQLRHVLILLLIILKESKSQETECRSRCSITFIQPGTLSNLPKLATVNLDYNQITSIQADTFTNLPWLETLNVVANRISVFDPSIHGMLSALRDVEQKDKNLPLGPNPKAIVTANTTAVTAASEIENQYEDVDQHDQTGQGQYQSITESKAIITAVLVTNHQYDDVSQHDQTGQGKSQANLLTKPTDTAITSGLDQAGNVQYQAITESLDATNLTYSADSSVSKANFHSLYTGEASQPNSSDAGHETEPREGTISAEAAQPPPLPPKGKRTDAQPPPLPPKGKRTDARPPPLPPKGKRVR